MWDKYWEHSVQGHLRMLHADFVIKWYSMRECCFQIVYWCNCLRWSTQTQIRIWENKPSKSWVSVIAVQVYLKCKPLTFGNRFGSLLGFFIHSHNRDLSYDRLLGIDTLVRINNMTIFGRKVITFLRYPSLLSEREPDFFIYIF